MKKTIFVLLALVLFSAVASSQYTMVRWRDSSGTIVPLTAEPIKVTGVTATVAGLGSGAYTDSTKYFAKRDSNTTAQAITLSYAINNYAPIATPTITGKATIDSLKLNGRGMVRMNAIVSQFAIKANNDVGFCLGLYRYGSTTPVAQIDTNGFLKASTVTRGTKTFTYAVKVDTNTSAVGVRTGDIVIVTPVVNTASDTTSIKALWVQKITSDTIFVIQTTSGAVVKPSYNWFVVK
jgi:hypothetical protein